MRVEGKAQNTNPYQCPQPAAFLCSGARSPQQNVEFGTRTAAWRCCFLLCTDDPHSLTRQLGIHRDRLSQGKAGQVCQEEAKRDFLGTWTLAGGSPRTLGI